MKKYLIWTSVLFILACSRTPYESEIREPVCKPDTVTIVDTEVKIDTFVMHDTTFISDTLMIVRIDTVFNTDTVTVIDTVFIEPKEPVEFEFDINKVLVREDIEDDRRKERFLVFTTRNGGTYSIRADILYSARTDEQYNESVFFRINNRGPEDPNAGEVYVTKDLNGNTEDEIIRRYIGTWKLEKGIEYSVSMFHYVLIVDAYPQFKNGEFNVDSVHLKRLILTQEL